MGSKKYGCFPAWGSRRGGSLPKGSTQVLAMAEA